MIVGIKNLNFKIFSFQHVLAATYSSTVQMNSMQHMIGFSDNYLSVNHYIDETLLLVYTACGNDRPRCFTAGDTTPTQNFLIYPDSIFSILLGGLLPLYAQTSLPTIPVVKTEIISITEKFDQVCKKILAIFKSDSIELTLYHTIRQR